MTAAEGTGSESDSSEPENEAQRVWLRLRTVFGAAPRRSRRRTGPRPGGQPYERGRDPVPAASALDAVTESLGWQQPLAQVDLAEAWREIAGAATAEHTSVEGVRDGVLDVRCDSTAWATQLTIMRATIAGRIAERYPLAGVQSIRFHGPNTPSWNRGPRSVPGRGPRDTYG